MIYYAYFHSVMKYGIIVGGGNSSCSNNIFKLQNWIIRIIKAATTDFCIEYLKKLNITITIIISLILFVIENINQYLNMK